MQSISGCFSLVCRSRHRARSRHAFTLIELLLVIAIIALLVSILLPALGRAREVGWQTVCSSNMSQIGKAANMYANDWKDQLWPQWDWAPITYQLSNMPAPAVGAGLLYQYVDRSFNVNECPKNKRKNISGTVNTAIDPQFGFSLGVGFDYTMIGRFQGVRLGSQITTGYISRPETFGAGAKPPTAITANNQITVMNGIPIYVEESGFFFNTGITDGLWGNRDQVTRRHFGLGNVVFFEGHAGPWKIPTSARGRSQETNVDDARNLDCNDIYVTRGGTSNWFRLEPDNTDNRLNWGQRPFGWANGPR